MMISRSSRFAVLFAGLFLAFSMVTADYAEARRGGSFGSRGTRTFQSVPPTRTAPQPAAPVERSMTPNSAANNAARQTPAAQRPGMFSGLGGSMMRGLLLGGLIGLLLGQGFGGLAGMLGLLLQGLLIGGAIMLIIRFFRSQSARNQAPAMAGVPRGIDSFGRNAAAPREADNFSSFPIPGIGSGFGRTAPANDQITMTPADLDTFQQRLTEVQEAFGREDHAGLRRLATPEMVSYLSEELADNAKNGIRNEVSNVSLLEADIAESWREDDRDYATAALRYESLDVMRDRASGKIVAGEADRPTETTELWTFTRQDGGDWKLAAIQQP
ncbi:Predicted lipid-binding transport protein, Tim44 family [Mesorhizobium escarrei]|uniref:Predicted lipid-binding transport protein, Tim44 family n=2 Tax=Mesorhizobium escarrei TaxID=666018 RepID=A0ABM9DX05_9HYPH|nr:Predicted lipid-binding transport protein, Tim44 family [Mesorhizobium escarrei]